jgi:hypothetical protein
VKKGFLSLLNIFLVIVEKGERKSEKEEEEKRTSMVRWERIE